MRKTPPKSPSKPRSQTAAPPTILLTGFEPFGGEAVNPSWQIAQALDGQVVAGATVQAVCLPCVFGQALSTLQTVLRRHRPVLVLCLGQAGGREGLTVERVAINVDDARIPDNAGQRPIDSPVQPRGPVGYFSTLPIKAIVAALQAAGLPASVSQTAGTYVCNHVFYGLMHALRRRADVRGGFIHVPFVPEQAAQNPGQPTMPLADQIAGVRLALSVALQTDTDLRISGGAED